MLTVTPNQSQIMTMLRTFLLAVLPTGVEVIEGQANRVAEPVGVDFVVMTPIRFDRLATNIDTEQDCSFTGSIAGTTLTVSNIFLGTVLVGATVFGTGVIVNTTITALGTGSGGVGTYTISTPQTVASSHMSTGTKAIEMHTKHTVQLDFHSANETNAADMAQSVSAALRDDFGVQQFATQTPQFPVFPLYADDPRQIPFLNAEQQYEWRWVLEAELQANQIIVVPEQFTDTLAIILKSVDAVFPP